MLNFISLVVRFILSLFTKSTEDKAVRTVIEEKQDALEAVENANKTKHRIINDPEFANRVQRRFERKGD